MEDYKFFIQWILYPSLAFFATISLSAIATILETINKKIK